MAVALSDRYRGNAGKRRKECREGTNALKKEKKPKERKQRNKQEGRHSLEKGKTSTERRQNEEKEYTEYVLCSATF